MIEMTNPGIPMTLILASGSADFQQKPAGKSSFPAGKLWKMIERWKQ
jgi:hypothetical protein